MNKKSPSSSHAGNEFSWVEATNGTLCPLDWGRMCLSKKCGHNDCRLYLLLNQREIGYNMWEGAGVHGRDSLSYFFFVRFETFPVRFSTESGWHGIRRTTAVDSQMRSTSRCGSGSQSAFVRFFFGCGSPRERQAAWFYVQAIDSSDVCGVCGIGVEQHSPSNPGSSGAPGIFKEQINCRGHNSRRRLYCRFHRSGVGNRDMRVKKPTH